MSVALKELSVLLVEDEAKIRDLLASVMEKVFKNQHPFQCSPRGLCNHNLSKETAIPRVAEKMGSLLLHMEEELTQIKLPVTNIFTIR